MPNRREKLLLQILVWTAITAAFGVAVFAQLLRRSATADDIPLLEHQLERLQSRGEPTEELLARQAALSAELSELEARFYAPESIDPYRFGILVRDLLAANGLSISRYQTIDSGGGTVLEFAVQGDALSFARFLQNVDRESKHWTIPFLSIRAGDESGRINAVFRIHYEVLDVAGN